ncbi:MAG TPA: DUF455 family protein [Candidatus Acidoferrum sp.]|nr:DUF455 family protein [Candidatus Acidoferrum sp.]
METIGTVIGRNGVVLRAGPAREACFTVVTDQAEMAKHPDGSLLSRREQLHGDVNAEIQSLEIAAQSLADFPDAPWELRLELARQCWDETRHAQVFLRRLLALDGYKGEFPIINQDWGVVCMFDNLPARLAVQNRIFEALSLDVFKEGVEAWTGWGDPETAEVIEGVMVDEIRHAAFANEWLRRLSVGNPSAMLKAVAAMSRLKSMAQALTPPWMKMEHEIPSNVEDKRHAGLAT